MPVKLYVEYNSKKGEAVPDGLAEEFVSEVVQRVINIREIPSDTVFDINVCIGTALMMDYFRLAVVNKEITPEELVFQYVDKRGETLELMIYENGRLPHWPNGFCDHAETVIMQILDCGS